MATGGHMIGICSCRRAEYAEHAGVCGPVLRDQPVKLFDRESESYAA